MKTAEEILKGKLNPSIAIINNADYTFNKVLEAMEEYAKLYHEQKLNIASVSGKHLPSFLYDDGYNNIRVGVHGDTNVTDEWQAWLNASASGASDKTVSDGLYCNCTLPNRNTPSNWCGTCNKMIAGNSVGRF